MKSSPMTYHSILLCKVKTAAFTLDKRLMNRLIIILSFILIQPTFAHEIGENDRPLENWYYQLSVGLNYPLYKGQIHSVINRIEEKTDSRTSSAEISVMGLYAPIGSKIHSLIGIKFLNGSYDAYDEEVITLHFRGVSYVHYFRSIGQGAFINFDIGTAGIVYNDSKIGEQKIDESGFAGRLGVGYAIPVFKETSLLFTLHNTSYKFNIGVVNSLSFNFGFLW